MSDPRRLSQIESGLPHASLMDTLRVGANIAMPLLAGGVIVRRPRVMALAERLQIDRRAVNLFQQLRARYGLGPLRLNVVGRPVALVLSPEDVRRVLSESPEPLALANREKRGALAHFQPHGVLVSQGGIRRVRRCFNEAVLDTDQSIHRLSGAVLSTVTEEAQGMLDAAAAAGHLSWDDFASGWWRIVRRIVLGDTARDDHTVTDLLARLRSHGNWSYLHPQRSVLRARFMRRLRTYLDRAEPGSLARLTTETPAAEGLDPAGQVPHWLFAFDAGGMVTFRTLALLATHHEHEQHVRAELADPAEPQDLPYLRACVLESVRLWPTTPAILRDSTTATTWDGESIPAGATFVIFAPFFHRDDHTLPYAHRFTPEIWLDGRARNNPALVPFSAGAGECPGQNLTLFVTSSLLATLLGRHQYGLTSALHPAPGRPLPYTLNNFALDFTLSRRGRSNRSRGSSPP